MAYSIEQKPNTENPSVTYPYGDIKDDTGANNGTPVNRQVYADFHQFFQRLMDKSGIEANNSPDNAGNGFQLFQALDQYNKMIDRQNNGYLHYISKNTLPSCAATNNELACSKDFAYVITGPSNGDKVVKKFAHGSNVLVDEINEGSNPEYDNNAVDAFFDETSGMLYVLITAKDTTVPGVFDDGIGFLVYDENLNYQPSLSVTDAGYSNLVASGISVSTTGIWISATGTTDSSILSYSKSNLNHSKNNYVGKNLIDIETNQNASMVSLVNADSPFSIITRMGGGVFIQTENNALTFVLIFCYDRYTNKLYAINKNGGSARIFVWDAVNDIYDYTDTIMLESTSNPARFITSFRFHEDYMSTIDTDGVITLYKRDIDTIYNT